MSDIYDEILAEQPVAICNFGKLLRDLDPDDRAGLEAALENPAITQISVVNVLNRRGHYVDRGTISRHVRGKCVCFRK